MNHFKECNASKKLCSALALPLLKYIRWATFHLFEILINFCHRKNCKKSLIEMPRYCIFWTHTYHSGRICNMTQNIFFIKVGYTVIRFLDQAVILSALSMHAVDCIYIQHFKFNFWSLRPTVLPSIPPRFSFRTKLVLEACTLFIHIWKNKKNANGLYVFWYNIVFIRRWKSKIKNSIFY